MRKYIKFLTLVFLLVATKGAPAQQRMTIAKNTLSTGMQNAIKTIAYDRLGRKQGDVKIRKVSQHIAHVTISFLLDSTVQQDDWQLNISPSFQPDFNWAPHLTPGPENIIAQHVFRSPALIVSSNEQVLIVIPDLDILNKTPAVEWYMDMDAPANVLTLGMSNNKVSGHVLYERAPGASYPEGGVKVGFYLMHYTEEAVIKNPFRKTNDFFWSRWGRHLFAKGDPISGSLEPYVKHTYHWAFQSWEDEVWQQFTLDGKQVGAPAFIVNVTQSPNYPGEVNEREFRSVWNQAWFSSLRSASGLYRFARRTRNEELREKALLTKELALSFPKKGGFFYGLIGTEMETIEKNGKKFNRSKGWEHYFWGNSNRNPYTTDPEKSPFHVLDMSWTAYQMLRWYDELEKDSRLLEYARGYANALVEVQFANGFFPGWLDLKTLQPLAYLNESPETAMSVTFLLKLYQITNNVHYKEAALKAMDAVAKEIIHTGRWEDFETYWSCSRMGSEDWVGRKVQRNNMYKQNNFSMFWTAQALLASYETTGKKRYLLLGQRTLDELLMTQASWQPYFIPIKALGGFGVQNGDAEWNDARESLFSALIIQYGIILKKKAYIQRGLAALRASFKMMYCPENPDTEKQWEKKWPFFGKEDYGFMMENYGHNGRVNAAGLGIGEFTIYDWGNGAASETYNRLVDRYGKDFVNHSNLKKVL